MNFVFIVGGLVLLILGGNWLLKSAVSLSLKLNIPKVVIGMTVVSFATSAPELIVSLKAALYGAPDLALGNVIGSNIANLGLVLGITLLLGAVKVEKSFYKTDWPVMILASLLLYFFLADDLIIVRYEGFIMLVILLLFMTYLLRFQKNAVSDEISEEVDTLSLTYLLFYLFIGGIGLWAGSELLVAGAKALAEDFGVSQRIIAITVVSVGTSIPELTASIIAVLKKEKAISLGNLIGSNIFNILAVLGITSIVTPIPVSDLGLLTNDIFWMFAISFLVLPFVFLPKKLELDWKHGVTFLLIYVAFIYGTL